MKAGYGTLKRLAAAVIATVAVAACSVGGHHGNGDDNYFSEFHTLDDTRWDYAKAETFEVDTLRDSLSRGGMLLVNVRHTHGFEYANLWLEVGTRLNDSTFHRDTLNIRLADNYGRWLGKGVGPSLLVTDTLKRRFDLHRHQIVTLRHIMRTDTLEGIEQVGIVFLPNEQQ